MSQPKGLALKPGTAAPIKSVPDVEFKQFEAEIVSTCSGDGRIAALFGQSREDGARLYAILAFDGERELQVLSTRVQGSFPSMTPACPQAHLFEREIHEQLGISPEGHPWLKPVRRHSFNGPGKVKDEAYSFLQMHGEEIHEVAVGPVHAGVIEPGHFRFLCQGELVHHLEIHLGYQQRGVERMVEGGPHPGTLLQMETVAGDTTIGHATAYCMNLEALAASPAPPRALALRAVALELERMANHVGDLGALSGDVAFLPTASFCGRLRGDFLNMTATLCGSRFGRGLLRPGGVAFDLDGEIKETLLSRLDPAERDVRGAVDLMFETESARSRMEGTGVVGAREARELGLVGVAARASGLPRDARVDQPSGWYAGWQVATVVEESGDVLARALVRRREVEQSITLVRDLLSDMPSGPIFSPSPALKPDHLAVSLVEGWRGEIVHVCLTGPRGAIARHKVIDPSFRNWQGLAMALRGEQISNFPLCNKSFNLSYCGFDL